MSYETRQSLENDGWRALLSLDAGRLVLRSRRGRNLAPSFPEVRSGRGPAARRDGPGRRAGRTGNPAGSPSSDSRVASSGAVPSLPGTPSSGPPTSSPSTCCAWRAPTRPGGRTRAPQGCSGTPLCRTEPHRAVGAVPVVPLADLGIHGTADRALPTTRPVRWRPPVPADVDPQRSRPAIPQFRGGHSADLTAECRAGLPWPAASPCRRARFRGPCPRYR